MAIVATAVAGPAGGADAPLRWLTAALYRFADLPDCAELREPLLALCLAGGVRGTLLLAPEGINGTIAGPEAGVHAVLAHIRQHPALAALTHKEAWANAPPFSRMKVRLKREIVTLRVPGLDPARHAGQYVKPAQWNALLADPDVLLIDTRNAYEVAIGTFAGAINPGIRTFTDLPAWLDAQPELQGDAARERPIAMFCTGGIRCEKSTALMRQRGYRRVYHLEGGILKYLEDIPEADSVWQGGCFVFDERVSVGHGLQPDGHLLCRACRWPLTPHERQSPQFEEGVSCPHCAERLTPALRQRLTERQRQVELARTRGQTHVGGLFGAGGAAVAVASGIESPDSGAESGFL